MAASTPSLRRMWTTYKRIAAAEGTHGKRDLLVAQAAFYAGARGLVRVFGCSPNAATMTNCTRPLRRMTDC
jgi:hypothetical protein